MKLNTKTVQIIKNFSNINPGMRFREGNELKTMSTSKTIIAKAQLDQDFPVTFTIYELSKFLSAVSLFKEPELEFTPQTVRITSGESELLFHCSVEDSIVLPPEKDLKLPSEDVSFTLSTENFDAVMKGADVLGLPEICVRGKDGKIFLEAYDSKQSTNNYYHIAIGETDKTFLAVFKKDNINKILPLTYNITMSSKGLSYFKGEGVEYWIALEAALSKFE